MTSPADTIAGREIERLFQKALHAYSDEQALVAKQKRAEAARAERQEQERLQRLLYDALGLEVPVSSITRIYNQPAPVEEGWVRSGFGYVPRGSQVLFIAERHVAEAIDAWHLAVYVAGTRGGIHSRVIYPNTERSPLSILGEALSYAGANPFTPNPKNDGSHSF